MLDALKSQQLRPHFPFSFNISGHHGGVAAADAALCLPNPHKAFRHADTRGLDETHENKIFARATHSARLKKSRGTIYSLRAAFMRQFVSLLSLCTPQKHCRDEQDILN
jgi:hypothetical protein